MRVSGPVAWPAVSCPEVFSASTTGIRLGLALRWGDSGTVAVHTLPFQAWGHGAALSMISPVSGNRSSALPRSAAGSPCTLTFRVLPSEATCAWLSGTMPLVPASTGLGWALAAASKAAPLSAVVL